MIENIVKEEIGSEFWDIPILENKENEFPRNTKWFISGTSALQYIIEDIMIHHQVRSAAIPSWCCSCMIEPFIKSGIEVFFYSVYMDEKGILTIDYTTSPVCEMTMLISYFGYTGQQTVGNPSGIIIRDLTHSLFCERKADATYYFGSLRKWAGFWTGGYAWKTSEWDYSDGFPKSDARYVNLRKLAMERKLQYLQGKCDDKTYLNLFKQAEDFLDHCGVIGGSRRDEFSALHFDINLVKMRRRENAQYLISELGEYALFPELADDDCPLFVPLILKKNIRNGLRKYLIEHQIYCPIHWSVSNLHCISEAQIHLYDQEISIVCDQRYGNKEMKRIVDCIKEYLHGDY